MLRRSGVVERRRFRTAFGPDLLRDMRKVRTDRRRGRAQRMARAWFAGYAVLVYLGTILILSVLRGAWVDPLAPLYLLVFLATVVFVAQNLMAGSLHVLHAVALILVGTRVSAGAGRIRNAIYGVTLVFLLLRRNGGIEDMAALIPLAPLATPERIEETIVLVLTYLWVTYLLSRFFEAAELVAGRAEETGNADLARQVAGLFTSALAALFNTLLPLLLTLAVFNNVTVDRAGAVWDFVHFVNREFAALDLPILGRLFERWDSAMHMRLIGAGP